MKHWFATLVLALAVAAGSFAAFYAFSRPASEVRAAANAGDALEWIRAEFKLNDQQFAAVKRLHDEYGAVCNQHCMAIMAAEKRGANREEIAALENRCVSSMADHFRQVAAQMSPPEGERYLATVLPRIAGYAHQGSPNVEGRR